jgi:hypothetical protein
MVVAVMEKEEYEVGGQNLYKNHFTCYTGNTKKKKHTECIKTERYKE